MKIKLIPAAAFKSRPSGAERIYRLNINPWTLLRLYSECRRLILVACFIIATSGGYFLTAYAQDIKPIKLLAARLESGKPFMQVLKERKSAREFSPQELSLQIISDMLWAACGINRPDSGYRTAPSARNMQEIDVYLAVASGLYLYSAQANTLIPVLSADIRGLTGQQPFVKDAPINLIYVADLAKMSSLSGTDIDIYAAADTGFISQNVYLFCASSGLATVVRGWLDKPALAKAMGLRAEQKIIFAQTVGYPKN